MSNAEFSAWVDARQQIADGREVPAMRLRETEQFLGYLLEISTELGLIRKALGDRFLWKESGPVARRKSLVHPEDLLAKALAVIDDARLTRELVERTRKSRAA